MEEAEERVVGGLRGILERAPRTSEPQGVTVLEGDTPKKAYYVATTVLGPQCMGI